LVYIHKKESSYSFMEWNKTTPKINSGGNLVRGTVDKLAAYEFLLAEHPLWTKEAARKAVRALKPRRAFNKGGKGAREWALDTQGDRLRRMLAGLKGVSVKPLAA
jgi:hypothetical protein